MKGRGVGSNGRKLKVYGGYCMVSNRGQVRHLVATTSRKRAVELCRERGVYVTLGYITDYWSETGNANELSFATHEGVWASTKSHRNAGDDTTFIEVRKKRGTA
jgi:hypothetical protein